MGLFRRATNAVQAQTNKVLDRLEDPNASLDLSYEKMVDMLQDVKRSLVSVVTQQKRIESELKVARKRTEEHKAAAVAALKNNREDLAHQALELKQGVAAHVENLEEAYERVGEQVERLRSSERKLSERIESFRIQKELTKAAYSSSRAEVKIGESISGISKHIGNAGEALQRANDKTAQMMARAQAITSLTDEGVLNDQLDNRSGAERELDDIRKKSAVDDELAQLKASLKG